MSEKFSFSLTIIVTLIFAALALSEYLQTNDTFITVNENLETENVEVKKIKDKFAKESAEYVVTSKIVALHSIYLVVLPAWILTLVFISLLFLLQIVVRGMWFSVIGFSEEASSSEAAARLDRLSQIFYSLSFALWFYTARQERYRSRRHFS